MATLTLFPIIVCNISYVIVVNIPRDVYMCCRVTCRFSFLLSDKFNSLASKLDHTLLVKDSPRPSTLHACCCILHTGRSLIANW